jgi:hypothetical protein
MRNTLTLPNEFLRLLLSNIHAALQALAQLLVISCHLSGCKRGADLHTLHQGTHYIIIIAI